jgi:hypothetical protein
MDTYMKPALFSLALMIIVIVLVGVRSSRQVMYNAAALLIIAFVLLLLAFT